MTDEPTLFDTRRRELVQLIEAHLERGSLDEGNATAFDRIIDAWLSDEIARLEGAVTDWANRESAKQNASAAARAASEAERNHRHLRGRLADERWHKILEVHHSARAAAVEARKRSLAERVRAAEQRLEYARLDFAEARKLLFGPPVLSTPIAGISATPDATGTDSTECDPDEVAR